MNGLVKGSVNGLVKGCENDMFNRIADKQPQPSRVIAEL